MRISVPSIPQQLPKQMASTKLIKKEKEVSKSLYRGLPRSDLKSASACAIRKNQKARVVQMNSRRDMIQNTTKFQNLQVLNTFARQERNASVAPMSRIHSNKRITTKQDVAPLDLRHLGKSQDRTINHNTDRNPTITKQETLIENYGTHRSQESNISLMLDNPMGQETLRTNDKPYKSRTRRTKHSITDTNDATSNT